LKRIASDSALYRDKWRRPDYIKRTIDVALRPLMHNCSNQEGS